YPSGRISALPSSPPRRSSDLRRIVADAGIQPGDLVFDLGAGTGAITLPLIEAGADVVAIELHPRRVAALRRSVAGRAQVVQADRSEEHTSELQPRFDLVFRLL